MFLEAQPPPAERTAYGDVSLSPSGVRSGCSRGSTASSRRSTPLQPHVEARRNPLLLALGGPDARGGLSPPRLHTRVPKLDVQPIDLLDEHQNRATDSG